MAHSWRDHWLLDPEISYLNHGSFGACPGEILAQQDRLRRQLEAEPVRFLTRELEPRWDETRRRLAQFLAAPASGLVLVPNATHGVNAVLRTLPLRAGDELLTTSHAYNACQNALHFVADRAGARVVVADLPFLGASADALMQTVLDRVTHRTRLVLLDHVTSPTALVLPLEKLVPQLRTRHIETLVDGAHAPGMVPIDLQQLQPTYYVGNCHKWMCAPKGAAFLYVAEERQAQVRPLVISHGANSRRTDRSRYWLEFDWLGTFDPTPWLCVPLAIQWLDRLLPGGWEALRRHNHHGAVRARQTLAEALQVPPPCPESLLGAMATLPLPTRGIKSETELEQVAAQLHDRLLDQYRVEVPVFAHQGQLLLRISWMLYNTPQDLERLTEAVTAIATR